MLKRHELTMLNEESRLSYNWDQRPTDTEELILRNTYLNASHKDKCTISTPSKPTKKEKRRITWKIANTEKENVVKQHSKGRDHVSNFRNQVLLSVRKILNKDESVQSKGSTMNASSEQKSLPLKKYKSTYTLASLSSLQRLQKIEEIPVVLLNLTQSDEPKRQKTSISIKRAKTEGSECLSISKNQPKVSITFKESENKTLTHRRVSDSLKKLRAKQQSQISERKSSKSQIFQNIR